MIWIIMMNVFIVAAGAGGDRWLMKTIMRMVLFFLFVAVAERNMGAVFAAGIVFTAAWAALSLFEAETKKKRHANKVSQCRVRENIINKKITYFMGICVIINNDYNDLA